MKDYRSTNVDGNVVETEELTKTFRDTVAVDSLTLQVPRGTIFGFIGPSGCGKTTTIRLLTGVFRPTSGRATVLGKNPVNYSKKDREKIGYLTQHFVWYPELSVWENLNFAAAFYGVSPFRRGRLRKLLEFVELMQDRHKLAGELSGGMQRRLSLAAALAHGPEVLFLDEPTAGVDPILRRKFWDYFKELQQQGHTLFVTTQYVGEAAYCDRVGVMSHGKLLAVENPDDLRKKAYGGDVIGIRTTEWIKPESRQQLESLPYVRGRVLAISDREIEVIVDDASTAIPQLVEHLKAQRLNTEMIERMAPPFDDVFVKFFEMEKLDE